jgi:hypothetical protein
MAAPTSTLKHIKTDHTLVDEDPRHKLLLRVLDYGLIIALSGFAIYCVVIVFSMLSTLTGEPPPVVAPVPVVPAP